jgi:RNA polymerase sigma factor (sigma-70 family)
MSPSEDPDSELVRLAQEGDTNAFDSLVLRHRQSIYNFARRSVGSDAIAQDLSQEAFVRAWFALPKFQPKAKFRTWLQRITVNLCRDFARSNKRQGGAKHVPIDSENDMADRLDTGPDKKLEAKDELSELRRSIYELPSQLKEVLILVAVEQYSHQECAEILGISTKAVENKLRRARRLLVDPRA